MSWDRIRERWGFPKVVNGVAARVVGCAVAAMALGIILTGAHVLLPFLALGFLLRVLSGPKLSPLGLFATKIAVPLLGAAPVPTPGAPKQFAQAIGLAFTVTASVLALALDSWRSADLLLAVLAVCAGMEGVLDLCVGCRVYAILVDHGWVPEPPEVECPIEVGR